MRTCGPTGRRPKVPYTALEAIEQALLEGALAHGFATEYFHAGTRNLQTVTRLGW